MNRFRRFWDYLRSSFWFVPSLMVGGSIVLAAGLIELDTARSHEWFAQWPRLFGAGAEGARGMMSTIATSMMTVVGVTFSMILVVLALASSQYTSRVLRNFIRSRVTQFVLGTFAGIFTYCLIVLRSIRGNEAGAFVPALAVFFGFVLALAGVSALIFFIHHVATSIQASSIIATVADETMLAIDRLLPGGHGQGPTDDDEQSATLARPGRNWQSVPARESGYIQNVDGEALLRLARKHRTTVRMERGIGEFVVDQTPLVSLDREGPPDGEIIGALQSAYSIDRRRTLEQDVAFGIRQIVDIALRALSPSTNDTTTAVMCLDHLTAILSRVASRRIPPSHRYEDGDLRVITIGPTFATLLEESFDQIRGSAVGNVGVLLRMLVALQTIASLTASPSRRRSLREQVEWIAESAERTVESLHDRSRIDVRLKSVREALEGEPASHEIGP